ncbi:MAG: alkaline phytoceramidase [Gammaproteobacteria bacterium]|nr:alkaline phytoceramidase [Gammaproteobacteria bacterium]
MRSKTKVLLVIAFLPVVLVFLLVDPIPQWPEYHQFVDGRTLLGLANAHNVISNLGLLIVGAWGTLFALTQSGKAATGTLQVLYLTFFVGLILTGLGSAYYHYSPGSKTLIWDRLPMTIMFMGLFSSIIGELADSRVAHRLLVPLLVVGVGSVLWWAWTETVGAGDLRLYAVVQFVPPVLIVFMLLAFPTPRRYAPYIVGTLLLYVLAKLCEEFDAGIYSLLGGISGHSLKHWVSAAASGSILLMLIRRHRTAQA